MNSDRITSLKNLIRTSAARPNTPVNFHLEINCLDEIGVPQGAITEIVISIARPATLLLNEILINSTKFHRRVALIDGSNAFSPQSFAPEVLPSLLWIRCSLVTQALKATDLILRDGNMPLVVLDLSLNPLSELKKIPNTIWYRLQALAEKASLPLFVFTPFSLVGNAKLRITLEGNFTLDSLEEPRVHLTERLTLQVLKRRQFNCDEEEFYGMRRSLPA